MVQSPFSPLVVVLILGSVLVSRVTSEHPACDPAAECGTPKTCSKCTDDLLVCRQLGLTSLCERFQNLTRSNFTTLDLSGNSFVSFDSFPVFTIVTKLLMSNNYLTVGEVTKVNIGRFPALVYLDLSDNKLGQLNEDMLEEAKQIVDLVLRNTSLTVLPSNVFKNTKALHSLNLQNNNFTEFPSNAFLPHNRITNLLLSNNPIFKLSSKDFENLGDLERLELDNTKILVIDKWTFASLPKLREIFLEHNSRLEDIDEDAFGFFSKIPGKMASSLEIVRIRGCNLHSLDEHTFNIRGLKQLWLSKNEWMCDCSIKWMGDPATWKDAVGKEQILPELENTKCQDLVHQGKSVLEIGEGEACAIKAPPRLNRPSMMAGMTTVLLISMLILALGLILGVMGFRKFSKRQGQMHSDFNHPYRAVYNQGLVQSHEDGNVENKQQKDPFEL